MSVRIPVSLLIASVLSVVAHPSRAADLWPDVLQQLQERFEPVMGDLPEAPAKGPGPRGRLVTLDLRTGERTEREDVALESLMGRTTMDGGHGLLEIPGEGRAQKNFLPWSEVADPSSGNYQKRVKLWMTFTDVNGMTVNSQCSGTLLDPYHVLTAAHCIYAWDTQNTTVNDWATTITVAAGYEGSSFPFGQAQAAGLTSWTGWTQNNDQDHDVGIITLDRPIGLLTGWYGFGFDEDCGYFENGSWHMAGYPAEDPFDGTLMYEATGNFDDCPVSGWDDQIRWYMPSSGGISGSGAQRDGYIWGVASTSDRVTRSSICRLTEGKFYDTAALLAAETPSSVDLLPMTIQAPASVTVGNALGTVSFILGNTASVSAAGTWGYEMYLSTDSQIDSGDILIDTGSFYQSLPPRGAAWVNLAGPVISGISVPAGTYSIGIILTNSDANNSNNDSSGQEAATITVSCPAAPSTPTLQTPANGATCVQTGSVWIQWSNVGTYAQYELQVGTSPGTGDVYSTPQTHYVLQNLDLSTTYHWRVRARRACGGWSSWSASRSFSTEIDPYTYTTLVSPAEGAHCQPAAGTMLEWTPLPQATWYEVQISDNWCYEGTIYQPVGTQLYLGNLTPNTTYYWRVRAMTSCGTYTNWSSVPGFCFTFKTAATMAASPVPNIPINGSSCASPDPYLQWNHTEDWDSYEIQVGTSCGTGTVYQTTSNGYQLQGLLDGITYHWRLRVTQECGLTSAWSSCSTFSVDAVKPVNPTTVTSTSHQTGVWSSDPTVDVYWDYGSDACSGWVEYGTAWDLDPGTIPDTPPVLWEPEFAYETSDPLADGIYWFHVRSIDEAGNWADGALHFGPIQIDANPPTTPEVTTSVPEGVWTNAAVVDVTWSATDAGAGVSHYLVGFDQSPGTVPVSQTSDGGISWAIGADGQWWVHVIAVDALGQQSPVQHYGPLLIDTSAPAVSARFPTSADPVNAGETYEIVFGASKIPDPDAFSGELKLSLDAGAQFQVVAELTEENFAAGIVEWTAPLTSSNQAMLRICIRDAAGNEGASESGVFTITGATPVAQIPGRAGLRGNYPNPFNPRTTIEYALSARARVRLDVFDLRGRLVRTLVDDHQPAGAQQVVWDGTDEGGRFVPSGVYLYRLRAGDLDETQRMTLIK